MWQVHLVGFRAGGARNGDHGGDCGDGEVVIMVIMVIMVVVVIVMVVVMVVVIVVIVVIMVVVVIVMVMVMVVVKVIVTPSNILRYNQAYKFVGSRFEFKYQSSPKSLSEHLRANVQVRSQVDSKTSKEQAKVYYCITTGLYRIKPHVKDMVNMCSMVGKQHVKK